MKNKKLMERGVALKKNTKEVLVVVDAVNGFTKEGVFECEYFKNILINIQTLANTFKNSKEKEVILIVDSHTKDSKEFETYPEHCVEGTSEPEIVEELWDFIDPSGENVFYKNSTNAIYADTDQTRTYDFLVDKNLIEVNDEKRQRITYNYTYNLLQTLLRSAREGSLEKVNIVGGVTDICVMEFAMSFKKAVNELNLDVQVEVLWDLVETYDASWHNRAEWSNMAMRFMQQGGVRIRKQYGGELIE